MTVHKPSLPHVAPELRPVSNQVGSEKVSRTPFAERLYFVDNLRVVMTFVVIAHHVGQAYGPTGGEWPIQEATRAAILGPFFTVNRSFGMSFFFLIAGYFMVMACDAKGGRAFLRSRLLRLGLPTLFVALTMVPVQMVFFPMSESSNGVGLPEINVAHLWFVEHLLLFSGVYALWRIVRNAPPDPNRHLAAPPGYVMIVLFALALAVVTAVVRTWFPIDRWLNLLGFIRVAFADVPRDLSFFILGAVAYRQQWFLRFPTKDGMVWLGVGVLLAVCYYVYALVWKETLAASDIVRGIFYPIWESLLCSALIVGLLVLFRERVNFHGRLAQALADSQYAAYVLHLFVVILIQAAVAALVAPPFAKFVLVAALAVPLTFLLSSWVRKPLGM
jgi:surface polysaccharide O-acyltransferase-like enzyme